MGRFVMGLLAGLAAIGLLFVAVSLLTEPGPVANRSAPATSERDAPTPAVAAPVVEPAGRTVTIRDTGLTLWVPDAWVEVPKADILALIRQRRGLDPNGLEMQTLALSHRVSLADPTGPQDRADALVHLLPVPASERPVDVLDLTVRGLQVRHPDMKVQTGPAPVKLAGLDGAFFMARMVPAWTTDEREITIWMVRLPDTMLKIEATRRVDDAEGGAQIRAILGSLETVVQ